MAHGPLLVFKISTLFGLGVAFFVGCASVAGKDAADATTCVGLSGGPVDAGRDQFLADVKAPDTSTDAPMLVTNVLCGVGACVPGDVNACGTIPGSGGSGGSGGS